MEDTLRVRNRAIMLKRKTRIRPVDDARTYILSLRDKPGFVERFIDGNKDDFIPEAHEPEVEDSVTSMQEPTSTVHSQYQRKSAKKRETAVKRSWTTDECAAVERHLRKFIVRSQVPGKMDCQRCVDAEAQALGNRDWKAVKYFIKNRISAVRRKVK